MNNELGAISRGLHKLSHQELNQLENIIKKMAGIIEGEDKNGNKKQEGKKTY